MTLRKTASKSAVKRAFAGDDTISVHPDAWKRYSIVLANDVNHITQLFRFSVYNKLHEVELYSMTQRDFMFLDSGDIDGVIATAKAVLSKGVE